MSYYNLIWICPLCFAIGFFTFALLSANGHGESDEMDGEE